MKKILTSIFFLLIVAMFVNAKDISVIKLALTNVSTNAAAGTVVDYVDYSGKISGEIENIVLSFSTNAPNVDVDITTVSGSGTGIARTIYSVDNVTADASVAVEYPVVNTTGVAMTNRGAKIAVSQDKIRLQVFDSDATTVDATAYIVITQ